MIPLSRANSLGSFELEDLFNELYLTGNFIEFCKLPTITHFIRGTLWYCLVVGVPPLLGGALEGHRPL